MNEPLIIKCNLYNIRQEELMEIRKNIMKQMEDGVVILPTGFELAKNEEMYEIYRLYKGMSMKAGIWLNREYLQGGVIDKQVACSECDYTSGHVMSNWKYCPICGARMFITTEEMRAFMKEQEVSKGE